MHGERRREDGRLRLSVHVAPDVEEGPVRGPAGTVGDTKGHSCVTVERYGVGRSPCLKPREELVGPVFLLPDSLDGTAEN